MFVHEGDTGKLSPPLTSGLTPVPNRYSGSTLRYLETSRDMGGGSSSRCASLPRLNPFSVSTDLCRHPVKDDAGLVPLRLLYEWSWTVSSRAGWRARSRGWTVSHDGTCSREVELSKGTFHSSLKGLDGGDPDVVSSPTPTVQGWTRPRRKCGLTQTWREKETGEVLDTTTNPR